MDAVVETHQLRKRYRGHEALRGVDLTVPAGTVLGLLGHNGAGKTTTVGILTTLLRPDGGFARVAGFDVARQPHEVRSRIAVAGQYAALDTRLTGRENLVLLGKLWHLGARKSRQRAEELLQRFDLGQAANRMVETYSGGMRRRLDLACCLVTRPAVLFLDEPSAGLDPSSRQLLWDEVREQARDGITVVLTTQYLEEADELADRIVVLDSGAVIAEGTPEELKSKVGGEWLGISLEIPAQVPAALAALAHIAADNPEVDRDGGRISLPLADGMATIAAAAAALDRAGLAVTEFAVRRPSLDDVFLTLTGKSKSERPA
ncbi:ATP-binding cassette domain-containing protein [Amycolatopsis sp. H20-H5]|uniref:ATP-binding cassette domain-containing protein n=1 Tax=Amycolatopsis sp. H20-H5 TaxID=3046309 RepID=UPI002DBD95B3|nr:ATP-binding cassette domain-containing protein [Amycolatopsis sp. H20-H5]MEC3975541.1 ATP-binding cassette domain-containing protein [Amycolatopsis sp. H20-H5]